MANGKEEMEIYFKQKDMEVRKRIQNEKDIKKLNERKLHENDKIIDKKKTMVDEKNRYILKIQPAKNINK